ncbi:hypothetical protein ACSEE7_07795 [Halomonas cupida]|uniref:hypothetical protein n=1 Tax=Halomonas cupida TaxID=44933 RepID=UPI003EF68543
MAKSSATSLGGIRGVMIKLSFTAKKAASVGGGYGFNGHAIHSKPCSHYCLA